MIAGRSALPVTMVKEFVWCPVIPWMVWNYGVEPPLTPSMMDGIAFQQTLDRGRIAEQLHLEPPVEYQVYLEDPELRVYGVVDMMAGRRRKTIVEVKAFERSLKRLEHFKIQLYTYALIAVRRRIVVERAILLMKSARHEVDITGDKLELARRTVDRLWRAVVSPEPPYTAQDERKCSYCRYRRLCPAAATS